MDLKAYQQEALATFRQWRHALLETQLSQSRGAAFPLAEDARYPQTAVDAPAGAWELMRSRGMLPDNSGDYVHRYDAAGRPIPHVCFKVPTGGGKTLLAAAALRSLNRDSGLILWITPTAAIYQQTRNALRDRQHPCRQLLDLGSGGRVKFMEKDDSLTRDDLDNYLCVMLLSLPATNRQRNRDFLRMFRNSGRYPTLFPPADVHAASRRLLGEFPDLDVVEPSGDPSGSPGIRHSLFNVFKMQSPVVILDEAHKAYGSRDPLSNQEYVGAINQFDPSLVLELSATPNPGISNLLVDIPGTSLKDEQMVKLPVQVENHPGADWRRVLTQAAARLDDLDSTARSCRTASSRYIRPIAVVRVERTGSDQRDGSRVHAEDVREYLVRNLGVPISHVAVQSSGAREISRVDLMSPYAQIRWIITKSALTEGWDCPFAYVLVMLDNTTAQRAITQLVGRIMRQPDASRTGYGALDQCYVICMNSSVESAVQQVKRGLEREGLADLSGEVVINRQKDSVKLGGQSSTPKRGGDFVPTVLHEKNDRLVKLDYQKHILPDISWAKIGAPPRTDAGSTLFPARTTVVDVSDAKGSIESEPMNGGTARIEWFSRQLVDLIPNPWMAARLTKDFLAQLRSDGYSLATIFQERSRIAGELREHVAQWVDDESDWVFRTKLSSGIIRLDLEVDQLEFPGAETGPMKFVVGDINRKRSRSTRSGFHAGSHPRTSSKLGKNWGFAWYADEPGALTWWRRVAMAKVGGRSRFERRDQRLWPDFVVSARRSADATELLLWKSPHSNGSAYSNSGQPAEVREVLESALDCGTVRVKGGPTHGNYRLLLGGLTGQ